MGVVCSLDPINMPSSSRVIPLVNLQDYLQGDEASKKEFSEQLASAFHNIGFVGVTQHGIPKELISDFYQAAKKFFALPVEEKKTTSSLVLLDNVVTLLLEENTPSSLKWLT